LHTVCNLKRLIQRYRRIHLARVTLPPPFSGAAGNNFGAKSTRRKKTMLRKMLITTAAIAAMCVASTAMAMDGGGGGAPAGVISGGQASGVQFGHGGFGLPFHKRFHKTVVFPYGYYDNDYPTDTFGDDAAMTYSPPIVPPEPSPTCQRNVETFTVPSSAGGTRQIKIISCP
jgi:hypothetical protein